MKVACEVVVNGEESFFVDKGILSSFCGRISKLLRENPAVEKVELHDLPGGAEAFELIARFCYGNGLIRPTPANTCLLHCAAHFMEMEGGVESTAKSLEGVSDWTWSEVIGCLKQCQGFVRIASSSGALDKLLDSLAARIAAPADASSPTSSSPESSGLRCSFDTRSTQSTKTGRRTWWFEDVAGLRLEIVEKAVKLLISRKLDHVSISRFLFYYLRVSVANANPEEKRRATENVVDLLYSLDRSSVPCKSLFGTLRAAPSQNLSKLCRCRLERMVGVRIDQLTLDNLLVPAPMGMEEGMYDVDLVLRFLNSFVGSWGRRETDRLKKVGSLIDSYLTEVAPDPALKPLKFVALAGALPDDARDSNDPLYRAIDMYLEVHPRLSEEEKTKICCAVDYEKLSSESCKHLAQNPKFPSRTAVQALACQHSRLKSLLKDTNNARHLISSDGNEQIVVYARKLDLSKENEKLRENLQGMQWKVRELERVCRKMQAQMAKMTKGGKMSGHRGSSGSLPKLCS